MHELDEASAVRLADKFQLAAFGLESWKAPLSMVASAARAQVGQLAVLDDGGTMVTNICTGVSDDEVIAYEANGGADPSINLRTRALIEAPALRCVGEADFTTPERLTRDPFYNDFFLPRDLPFSCLSKLFHDRDGTAGLALLMPARRGHVEEATKTFLEGIVPRIAEAVRGSATVAKLQNKSLAALASQAHGTFFLLAKDLRIRHLSDAAERLVQGATYLACRQGRLCCTDPQSHVALERAMAKVAAPARAGRHLSLRIQIGSFSRAAALEVELIALPPPSHDGLMDARAVLVVHEVAPSAAGARDKLRRLFGLTEAEAEICTLLVIGEDARRIAGRRGSSVGTVRNQIKVTLEKTNTRRQVELVLLLRQCLS